MRMYPREFPPNRRKIPKRRAEREVYEALTGSDHQGFVYYEWRKGYGHIELDFAVWIEGLGRFALQVKGGCYLLIDSERYSCCLTIANYPEPQALPAAHILEAAA